MLKGLIEYTRDKMIDSQYEVRDMEVYVRRLDIQGHKPHSKEVLDAKIACATLKGEAEAYRSMLKHLEGLRDDS